MDSVPFCVAKDTFYEKLDALKGFKKSNSKLTVFIDDEVYENAKNWLKNESKNHEQFGLTKTDVGTIKRKQWTIQNDNILSKDRKIVVPRSQLHGILSQAHSSTAHRGRDKTEEFVKRTYAEISLHVVTLFVGLCHLHQQQKSVTDHLKRPITKPIQASNFLAHVQLDLIDFRNLNCSCGKNHNWLLHATDHYSKFSWLFPLSHKTSEEVLETVTQLFWQVGFPKKLHTDNGREFKNKNMIDFCNKHKIDLVNGAPRTPQTQGLVERNNRTVKENLANILKEKQVSLNTWCRFVGEAAYERNVTIHRATSKSPYELVFGILPHRSMPTTPSPEQCSSMEADRQQESEDENECAENAIETEVEEPTRVSDINNPTSKRKAEESSSQNRKQMKSQTNEKQNKYNEKMKSARPSVKKFEVNDYVCVKIDKVDKSTALHPNVLFGKIVEMENTYARIATKFGLITTLISPSRLTKCWRPNIVFETTKEITFTAACKMAMEQ